MKLALQTLKVGGHFRVLRGRRNTLEVRQCKRVVFSWQVQSFAPRRFALAWQAHHFVACPKCLFHESQCQGRAHETQCQKSWQAQHFVTALKNAGSLAKNHIFQVEPGKPGAEVSKKKTISQRKNSPIECAQGDQPLRCPNGVF